MAGPQGGASLLVATDEGGSAIQRSQGLSQPPLTAWKHEPPGYDCGRATLADLLQVTDVLSANQQREFPSRKIRYLAAKTRFPLHQHQYSGFGLRADEFDIVRHNHSARAVITHPALHDRPVLRPDLRVERTEYLVKQQKLGLRGESHNANKQLLLSPGELLHEPRVSRLAQPFRVGFVGQLPNRPGIRRKRNDLMNIHVAC